MGILQAHQVKETLPWDAAMKVLQRYIAVEVVQSVVFVLIAFLAFFAFFDLLAEVPLLGRGGYQFQHALLYVLLGMPAYTYDLMPIAALIGTIYVLSQLASRSEFTIMRVSSMSTGMAGWILVRIGLVFMVVTFLFGEIFSPMATDMAEKLKLRALGSNLSQEFSSGSWTKDVIRDRGATGTVIGSRFVNIRIVNPNGQLEGVKLYEFDRDFHLIAMILADHADYQGNNTWRLQQVAETHFPNTSLKDVASSKNVGIVTKSIASRYLISSDITPDILAVSAADPDHMSAYDLSIYTRHLSENNQDSTRYKIAFWKKIIYPFAVLVMMALALPFAYLHFRAGGVSLKIFIGIMIGVTFHLLNNLFSHLGLLNTWPPLVTAIVPSALFLLIAIGALWWVERH
jgi:lipopolysaccharide export system permease protein